MPPRPKGKGKATDADRPSARLRQRTSTAYDEDLADEEDGEDELWEPPASAEGSDAGSEAQAAPLVPAGRGKGRGRGRGKGGAPAAAPPAGRGLDGLGVDALLEL